MHHPTEPTPHSPDLRVMRGISVSEIVLGTSLRLHIGPHGIEIHSPAVLTTGRQTHPVHAPARTNLDQAAQLLDQVIADIHPHDTGALQIRFANGWHLDVPATTDRPAWTIALAGRHFLTPTPGGTTTSDRRRP
ncbi:DUF6188 family protein [Kitasatospora sp. NPDC004745]|uniref:DUF6188 family protein n=1 Tax=unclassified Kitasatospora TaxID=2633591 RepID=UPI003673B528